MHETEPKVHKPSAPKGIRSIATVTIYLPALSTCSAVSFNPGKVGETIG
jgi:hypothetical protein